MHNAGNDAFLVLLAFQKLVDAEGVGGIGGIGMGGQKQGVATAMGTPMMPPVQGVKGTVAELSPRNSTAYPAVPSPVAAPTPGLGHALKGQMSLSLPKIRSSNGTGSQNGHGIGIVDLNIVDEMGKMQMSKQARRASFNPLMLPLLLPVDKGGEKTSRHGHGSGSGSGGGSASPIGSGSGSTSPPMIGHVNGLGGHAKRNSTGSEENGGFGSGSGASSPTGTGNGMIGVRRVTMAFRSVTK